MRITPEQCSQLRTFEGMKLIAPAVALVLVSLLAAPVSAQAASNRGTVVGHVRNENGKPLAGISVSIANKTVVTDKRGRYSVDVIPAVRDILINDTHNIYADTFSPKSVHVVAGEKTVVNETLHPAASVSGHVLKSTGGAADDVRVAALPVDSHYGTISTVTSATGTYKLTGLSATTYTLQFLSDSTLWEYLGDAPTQDAARTFALGYGEKLTGQNETVTPSSSITGKLYVNGEPAIPSVERADATLTDVATGVVVASWTASDTFKFRGIPAGDYRIAFTPAYDDWIVPSYYGDTTDAAAATTIHVEPGQKLYGLAATLTLAPVTHHLGSLVETSVTKTVKKGGTIRVAVNVRSYGDPTGARVDVIWGSKLRGSGVVGADGRVTIRVPAPDVASARKKIKIYYQGTATTERHPVYDYVKVK
jgi:hypothetical protein